MFEKHSTLANPKKPQDSEQVGKVLSEQIENGSDI